MLTLIAHYPDPAAARRATAMLARAGVGDDAISVVGDVLARADTSSELAKADRSMIRRIFWAGLIWGGIGAVLGGAIGYALAIIGFPTDNMAIQVASWAMFVHIAATLWAAYAVIYDGSERDRTPTRPRPGDAMVIVRSPDPTLLDHAERILTQTTPTSLRRA
jgi:hypothetical protein